ncbi:MAG: alpha amylase C-terminal domain-containing protein [Verrucomicrobia bacterium]|nr:alpha amylase C-terminal domain-containing protein [Verrucomicrobiota bacterium]
MTKIASHPKLYESRGAHVQGNATKFQVYAPHAQKVSLVLTAYGKQEHKIDMQSQAGGVWEVTTPHAKPGRSYLYEVVDSHGKKMLRTDPFSFSTTDAPRTDQVHSVVVDPSSYQWGDDSWMDQRAKKDPLHSPLSIYEVQVKSWKSGYNSPLNFRELADELVSYCHKMHFTHVECYSLLEHMYKEARGYQVANFFAPYHSCGSYDDLKYFVDKLHQNGIGVILDWIPTHFQHYHDARSYSASLHEWDGTDLFAAEKSEWGTRYLDYGKEETRRLMFASALYFLDQLHIDGIRFDAISQMVRRNGKNIGAGISFLRELNDTIHAHYPGVMTIAEETEGFPNVTIATKKGGLGFDLKWNIRWSHASHNFLQTPYSERAAHWKSKISHFLRVGKQKQILTHSHDDTDAGDYSNSKVLMQRVSHIKDAGERFAHLRNFFSWQILAPSYGHLIHMGDELAQNESWYQRFRRGTSSVDWSLTKKAEHQGVQECVKDLNALYVNRPQFWEKGNQDFTLIAEHAANGVVAYHRGTKDGKRIAVVHNFSNVGYESYDIPLPKTREKIKRVSELFNSDALKYEGSGSFENRDIKIVRHHRTKKPTHLRVSLPPLSTLVLEETVTSS